MKITYYLREMLNYVFKWIMLQDSIVAWAKLNTLLFVFQTDFKDLLLLLGNKLCPIVTCAL